MIGGGGAKQERGGGGCCHATLLWYNSENGSCAKFMHGLCSFVIEMHARLMLNSTGGEHPKAGRGVTRAEHE